MACNLDNFLRQLGLTRTAKHWALAAIREKRVKIGAKLAAHARRVIVQMAEVAVRRRLFTVILQRIRRLGRAESASRRTN